MPEEILILRVYTVTSGISRTLRHGDVISWWAEIIQVPSSSHPPPMPSRESFTLGRQKPHASTSDGQPSPSLHWWHKYPAGLLDHVAQDKHFCHISPRAWTLPIKKPKPNGIQLLKNILQCMFLCNVCEIQDLTQEVRSGHSQKVTAQSLSQSSLFHESELGCGYGNI